MKTFEVLASAEKLTTEWPWTA